MTEQIQLPPNGEPTDGEVIAIMEFLDGEDWFSDYDGGISVNLYDGKDMARANPGDWIVRDLETRSLSIKSGSTSQTTESAPLA